MKKSILAICLTGVLATTGNMVHADEVEDAIQEALTAYQQQDYSMAKQSLGMATQLINQLNAKALGQVLPEPLAGWQAKEIADESQAGMMFGGGISVSRDYSKDNKKLKISIIGDSPMLAQMMGIFQNPMIAGSMGKMTRIGKQMAMEGKNGQLTMVVANRFMVTIDGSASMEDKTEYAKAMDLEKLKDF
ncbi:MAG: hypothetical protein WC982_04990 [Advenella sp.]